MRKKLSRVIALLGLVVASLMLTGCGSIQGYSIRSYQGPLPMADYNNINPEAYGVPLSPH